MQYAVVNITTTYASVRRPIRLRFFQRLVLRIAPICFLFHCSMRLLSHLRCQCPDTYPLSWPVACITREQTVLWYAFKCICLSYFFDAICAGLEMRTRPSDSGMTVIEYGFAFAETGTVTPSPELLIATLLLTTGTLLNNHVVVLFNLQSYRVLPPKNTRTLLPLLTTS